ncbi:MAG: DUF493 domain-containing protein [Pseudohongiella sp.]|nr:DUF493 domain-containing protein [Pseudohongiella sp.]MDO9518643.1 DUF493 domain-containing protein [Pseudohongiella sp.]MDP2128416.1 DUF493 domain-containing protein [Pseudohongiella sp.]
MQNFTTENTPNAPRIEFPCRYPVKVMGEAHEHFHIEVLAVFRQHASDVKDEHVTARPSAKGNFVALTIEIEATGVEQLENLFADLKKLAAVKLVL